KVHGTKIDIKEKIIISRSVVLPYEIIATTPDKSAKHYDESVTIDQLHEVNEDNRSFIFNIGDTKKVINTNICDAYIGMQGMVIQVFRYKGENIICTLRKFNPGYNTFFENLTQTVQRCLDDMKEKTGLELYNERTWVSPFVY